MKYFLILLFCTASCFAQTRSQLLKEREQLREALDQNNYTIDFLLNENAELARQIADLKETLQIVLTEALKPQQPIVVSKPAPVVIPVLPYIPPPEPVTVIVRQPDTYQPPVFDSPVHCSGYDIPTPGLTLTYQNCQ